MLDLNFVRENLPLLEEKLLQRGMDPAATLKNFREIDARRRQAITELETLQARRNRASEEIARLKKEKQDATVLIADTKDLREKIQRLEEQAQKEEAELRQLLAGIPNIPHKSVPVGNTAEDNVEIRRWGQPPRFEFAPSRTGSSASSLASSILNVQPRSRGPASRFIGTWERSWSARSPTSCSICIRENTATPKFCRPTW